MPTVVPMSKKFRNTEVYIVHETVVLRDSDNNLCATIEEETVAGEAKIKLMFSHSDDLVLSVFLPKEAAILWLNAAVVGFDRLTGQLEQRPNTEVADAEV